MSRLSVCIQLQVCVVISNVGVHDPRKLVRLNYAILSQ